MAIPVSLFYWVAMVCCFIVNAEEKQSLPSGGDRQSKQMFAISPPLYRYYNPCGAQILIPTVHGQIHPESELFSGIYNVKGDSESALLEKAIKTEDISITPGSTECSFQGGTSISSCMRSSTALSGTINIQLIAMGQIAMVSIAPNKNFYSRVQITCTEVSGAVGIFMKSGDAFPSFSAPFTTTELKPAQMMVLFLDGGVVTVKCSWSSLF